MLYAHPLEVSGGVVCPLGIETSGSLARIHVGWLADDGGVSPLGDLVPDDRTAAVGGLDQLLIAEGFSQVNGALGGPWVVGAGGVQVSNGCAVSAAADGAPDLAWLDMAVADVELEGEFSFTGQAGFGLIARVNTASTSYLLLTVETGGTAVRLYKVVSGTATQLATLATSVNQSSWVKLRMVVRGNVIQCFINGWPAFGYELTGGDVTTFAGQVRHGFKLNAQVGGIHRCRRFVARS
jgi:hypothetical protein